MPAPFLRNYEVNINIGVHAFEKTGEQRVLINVDLYVPLALSTPQHDELEEVVDYDFIRRSISERVARGHIHLQETLCMTCWPRCCSIPRCRRRACPPPSPTSTPTARPWAAKFFGMK